MKTDVAQYKALRFGWGPGGNVQNRSLKYSCLWCCSSPVVLCHVPPPTSPAEVMRVSLFLKMTRRQSICRGPYIFEFKGRLLCPLYAQYHLKASWHKTFAHTSINRTYYIYTCINIFINMIIKMDKLSVAAPWCCFIWRESTAVNPSWVAALTCQSKQGNLCPELTAKLRGATAVKVFVRAEKVKLQAFVWTLLLFNGLHATRAPIHYKYKWNATTISGLHEIIVFWDSQVNVHIIFAVKKLKLKKKTVWLYPNLTHWTFPNPLVSFPLFNSWKIARGQCL